MLFYNNIILCKWRFSPMMILRHTALTDADLVFAAIKNKERKTMS